MNKAKQLLGLLGEGHSTVTFFAETPDYKKALKMLKDKIAQDRSEYGSQESSDSWVHASAPKQLSSEFATLNDAWNWLEDNARDYQSYAVKVKSPEGWAFGADIHI